MVLNNSVRPLDLSSIVKFSNPIYATTNTRYQKTAVIIWFIDHYCVCILHMSHSKKINQWMKSRKCDVIGDK